MILIETSISMDRALSMGLWGNGGAWKRLCARAAKYGINMRIESDRAVFSARSFRALGKLMFAFPRADVSVGADGKAVYTVRSAFFGRKRMTAEAVRVEDI